MSKIRVCAKCGEPRNHWGSVGGLCLNCGSDMVDIVENHGSTKSGVPVWRRKMIDMLRAEMELPETYWYLSFCNPDKPVGTQFLGAVIVRAHGITDALTKCNAMMINPGGEIKGVSIPDSEEVKQRLTPEVMYRVLSMKDMIDLGWEPVCMLELDK